MEWSRKVICLLICLWSIKIIYFRWKENIGLYTDFDDIMTENVSPLGESLIEEVEREAIKCKWVKLRKLIE